MTDDTNEELSVATCCTECKSETNEEMTEQIEASFGPVSVYVSGTDTDSVRETFDGVWETMMDTSDRMQSMKSDEDDDSDGPSGRTFG